MNKSVKKWSGIAIRAVCLGIFGVQLVYALLWAFYNGNNIQDFYDSALYIKSAVTMAGDGWRLIGYSAILHVFMGMQQGLGDYYVVPLYLTQAGVSLLCFTWGCKTLAELWLKRTVSYRTMLLPALYILTLPVVWQMQFAVLPDAFCIALAVLLFSKLAECVWDVKSLRWDAALVLLGCLLMTGLLHRHYFYGELLLCCVCVLFVLVRAGKKKYRTKESFLLAGIIMVCVCVTAVISCTVNAKGLTNSQYAKYSLTADMWDAFVYPNIQADYSQYPQNVKDALPQTYVDEYGSYYEYNMSYIAPAVESADPDNAEAIYMQMVQTGLSLHGREKAIGLAKEGIAYVLFPAGMIKYMYFNGNSLYGHNIMKMYETAPKLTIDYMHIGMNGLGLITLFGVFIFVSNIISDRKQNVRKVYVLLYCALGICAMVCPAMLFNMIGFDYRFGIFSAFVWAVFALLNVYESREKEK